jgi:hypothetical protein
MKSFPCRLIPVILLLFVLLFSGPALAGGPGLEGTWKFVPAGSTDIVTWGNSIPQIDISMGDGKIRVHHNWLERGNVAYADTFDFRPGGKEAKTITRSEVWPDNWFMGVLSSPGDSRTVSGRWLDPEKSFRVVTRQIVRTSQGKTTVTTTRDYTLGLQGKTLTLSEKRSSRPSPVVLVFERKEPSK